MDDIEQGQKKRRWRREDETVSEAIYEDYYSYLYFNQNTTVTMCSLIVGTPGLAKSNLMARLKEIPGFNFMNINPTSIFASGGESAANLKKIFEEASNDGPTILVIDEIDSLVSRHTESHQSIVGMQIKCLLLDYIDGLSMLPGIFVIATTNHPESLDTAFLDRCTKITKMSLPNDEFKFMKNYLAAENIEHNITKQEFLNFQTTMKSYRILDNLLTLAKWLVALAFVGLILFFIILILKAQGRLPF